MSQANNQQYWLGLHLIPDFGIMRISHLLSYFDSVETLWNANEKQLNATGFSTRLIEQFISHRNKLNLNAEMDKVLRNKAHLISIEDDDYPVLLRSLSDAPILLYVKGSFTPHDERSLAIVGTRKASKYGKKVAYSLAYHVASQNVTIVSGLAQGIDTSAHQGAIDADGRTIAVMGNGIEKIYPAENQGLAEKIMEKGALITELPIGTPPLSKNFPRRNRIISGMSLGLLVAEAPEKSGSLITAESALEQGRDVFAVPHNIFSVNGRGTNKLIQDGAKLVLRVRDILDELDISHINTQTRIKTEAIQPENDLEIQILGQLSVDPVHIDEIVRITHLSVQVVSSTLALLELKGLAESAGHMQYSRTL